MCGEASRLKGHSCSFHSPVFSIQLALQRVSHCMGVLSRPQRVHGRHVQANRRPGGAFRTRIQKPRASETHDVAIRDGVVQPQLYRRRHCGWCAEFLGAVCETFGTLECILHTCKRPLHCSSSVPPVAEYMECAVTLQPSLRSRKFSSLSRQRSARGNPR